MKKRPNHIAWILLPLAGAFLASTPSQAVETTGTPGSPSATTTIPGTQLPAPDQPFGGDIQQDALKSKAWWAPRGVPPKEAPNVLLFSTSMTRPARA